MAGAAAAPAGRPRRGTVLGCESGAAAVEFALLAPLLLAIVFAIITYGLYFTVVIAVTEAAAVGARASVPGLDCAERSSLATEAVSRFFSSYGPFLDPATAVATPACSSEGVFRLSVSYPITTLDLGLMAGFVPIPTAAPSATVSVSDGGL